MWLQIVAVAVFIASIGAVFGLMAARAHQLAGYGAVVSAWAVSSLAWGYLSYRDMCSQPLTCDVGGHAYWSDLVPGFTVIAAVTLAAAGSAMIWSTRRRPSVRAHAPVFALGRVAIAGLWAAGAWFAASLLVLNDQGWPRF